MEIRSLFKRIFGTESENIDEPRTMTELTLLDGYKAKFTRYDEKDYENIDVRNAIDLIARNVGKLYPKHTREEEGKNLIVDGNIQRLIAEQPNEFQNAYDFYYMIATELFEFNDAFVYIARDENLKVVALYPLHFGQYDFLEYRNELFVRFKFRSTKYVARLKDVIHLKRFVGKDGLVGGSTHPITKVLSITHAIDEGIVEAIKTTQNIKGIIKSTKSILKPEDVKKMQDDFIDSINSKHGIGALDATNDFVPVRIEPSTATDKQIDEFNNKIKAYYGISEKMLTSSFSEEEFNAFYENVIEPIATQMSLEFTNKIFTLGERFHKNKITFTSKRLQYASTATKIKLIKEMYNDMTTNERRELFGFDAIEGGDVRLQSLNYVNSEIVDEYQVGKDNGNGDENDGEEEQGN